MVADLGSATVQTPVQAPPGTLVPGTVSPRRPVPASIPRPEYVGHGIPDSTVLGDGDIVNVDVTAYLVVDGVGVHRDTNATFAVGEVDEETARLVRVARERLEEGIAAVRPGRAVNVIGRVVEKHAARAGTGTVREFTGHGISTASRSGLVVPHFGSAPEHDDVLEPGMTFTSRA